MEVEAGDHVKNIRAEVRCQSMGHWRFLSGAGGLRNQWDVAQLDRALDWLLKQNWSYRLAVGGSNPPVPLSAPPKGNLKSCNAI